jgi:hypothetical protein
MSNIELDAFLLYAGLSWKSEAFRTDAEAFTTGVFGGWGTGVDLTRPTDPTDGLDGSLGVNRGADVLLRSRDDDNVDGGGDASSGSTTNSRRRSAALSACSARARIASSTMGADTLAGGEPVSVDSA